MQQGLLNVYTFFLFISLSCLILNEELVDDLIVSSFTLDFDLIWSEPLVDLGFWVCTS